MITRPTIMIHMEGLTRAEVTDISPHGYTIHIDEHLCILFRHKRELVNFKNAIFWAVDNATNRR